MSVTNDFGVSQKHKVALCVPKIRLVPQDEGSNDYGLGRLRMSLAIGFLAARCHPELNPRSVELLDVLAYLEQLTNASGDDSLTT